MNETIQADYEGSMFEAEHSKQFLQRLRERIASLLTSSFFFGDSPEDDLARSIYMGREKKKHRGEKLEKSDYSL